MSSGDPSAYLNLITSEHAQKPVFIATVTASVQPTADQIALLQSIPLVFDLDAAIGVQLDTIGLWANRSRYAPDALDDDTYRALLRATVASHSWDGSIPGAYQVWDLLFADQGMFILIVDHQDMTMDLALTGAVPDAQILALLTGGYLNLKPGGVHIAGYFYPTVMGPLFGFDIDNSFIGGWDHGGWAAYIAN